MTDEPTDVGELFRLLGNETRMRIMRTLWDDFEFATYVTESQTGPSFADLRQRADVDDPGNFNYHLDQLTGQLVASTEAGYVLSPLGYNLMRAIDRFAAFEYETLPEWSIDDPCPFCGGTLLAAYRREILEVRCDECGGLAGGGNFTYVELPASGVRSLTERQLLDAAILTLGERLQSAMQGLCWDCRSSIETSLSVCSDHERGDDGTCSACESRFAATVDVDCPTCGTEGHGPLLEFAIQVPGVGAAFEAAGLGPTDLGPWRSRLAAFDAVSERITSRDPPAAELAFAIDAEDVAVTVGAAEEGVAIAVDRH